MTTYGKRVKRNADCFQSHIEELEPVIAAKHIALLNYKKAPSKLTLKSARSTAQRTARRCANDYWQHLRSHIQLASDTGNIRGMYDGITRAFGPTIKKIAPFKSKSGDIITDQRKQMDRWVEHYLELYRENVTETALNAAQSLPVMDELDIQPTKSELSDATDSLASGKAPGKDDITPEIIKSAKPAILPALYELLCLCWDEGAVPQDMRDANIINLYRNKGDCGDCNNYRGISLLSIVGKVFARVALNRLQKLAERVYPEAQCGFQAERSTIDMLFSLCQLQEKCREQQMPLYVAFIDLTKAFDLVSRRGLLRLLEKIGCPPKLLSIITSFHDNMKRHNSTWWLLIRPLSYPEWRETGLCSRTYTVWDLLLPATLTCIQVYRRGNFPPHKIRWQVVQPCLSKSEDQSTESPHQGTPPC
ncbi:protein-lysine N-methyltransferase EEF2KMT isoform X1 [Heterodontus francisci]|uniref:protein-lysine N-methyltransferase EEF2KMT isoform X1 n=1 Tax=Heterodontus francisci TaxID=7792 RepID=UPI00355B8473